MTLEQFAKWLNNNPRQSNSSMRATLGLRHSSQVESFLSRIEFKAERGPCPLIGRANVQLYSFVAFPSVPKLSIKTIRERRRAAMPRQTAEGADERHRLIFQKTVEPCSFPARCYVCNKTLKHTFERVAVVGGQSVVKATCKKCGKETTK